MKPGTFSRGPASCKLRYSPVIPPHLRGHMLEVTSVFTEESERGKGYATLMMQALCEQASKAGKALMLMPETPELIPWYALHGFEVVQKTPVLMARRA